jgi:hypothetical protein
MFHWGQSYLNPKLTPNACDMIQKGQILPPRPLYPFKTQCLNHNIAQMYANDKPAC